MNLSLHLARALAIVVALPVAIVFTSCEKPVSATATGPPEVLVTEVIQKEVPIFQQWVGTLNGSENADVRARTTGYLQSRNYQEGSYVKKGELLFQIDPRPFVAALDQAKGQLDQA
jgi:membrane fusion protein, multidrug efflux system